MVKIFPVRPLQLESSVADLRTAVLGWPVLMSLPSDHGLGAVELDDRMCSANL